MTTHSIRKTATPTAKVAAKTRKPRPARRPGEQVIRHDLLGGCHIALVAGTEAAIGKKAADALMEALRCGYARCIVQCKGYVFNLSLLPIVLLEPEPETEPRKAAG